MALKNEDKAESLIRRDLEAGRTPAIKAIAEQVGLTPTQVSSIRDRMLAGKKHAPAPQGYRDPGRVVVVTPPPPPPVESEAWRQGLDHSVKRIASKAARIVALIAEVEADLKAESGRDRLRAEEAALADKLAAVRAQLRGEPKPDSGERLPCGICDRKFKAGGLAIHRARSHSADFPLTKAAN